MPASSRSGSESRRAGDAPIAIGATSDAAGASPYRVAGPGPATPGADLDELKEIEPWAIPEGDSASTNVAEIVADALERVARRLRDGDIVLPADSHAATDQAAIALALAAVLGTPGR